LAAPSDVNGIGVKYYLMYKALKRRRRKTLNSRTTGMLLGVLLIIIALILGAVQHFGVYNIYGTDDYKWYFYGLVGVIGLIGIILAAWYFMKTEQPKKAAE